MTRQAWNKKTTRTKRSPNYRGMYTYLASLLRLQAEEDVDREKSVLSIDIQESKDKLLTTLTTNVAEEG